MAPCIIYCFVLNIAVLAGSTRQGELSSNGRGIENSNLGYYQQMDTEGHTDNAMTEYGELGNSAGNTGHDDIVSIGSTVKDHNSNRRILGGYTDGLRLVNYQGRLISKYATGASLCGCAILSTTRLLTAGHCCHNCQSVDAILGVLRITDTGTVLKNVEFVKYPINKKEAFLDDIAIVKTPAFTFTDFIQPIALPSSEFLKMDWGQRYQNATISGFGDIENNQDSEYLRYADVTILPNDVCNNLFGSFEDSSMCSQGPTGGACFGDSGGPLAIAYLSKPIVIGVISFGPAVDIKNDCSVHEPTVYTNVSFYIDWIRTQM